MGDEQMGHQTHRLPPCAYVLIRRVSDEQTAGDGAAQKRPSAHAVSAGLAGNPLSEMTDRWQGIVVAGRGDGRTAPARRSRALDSGGGQWRARSRSTRAILFSIHFTLESRSGGSDPGRRRQPRPQHACAARSGTHTARLDAGAATTTRISLAPGRRLGERERRRERASTGEERTKPCRPRRRFRAGPLDESAAG